jgi:osmotically-inducible protein OsmY
VAEEAAKRVGGVRAVADELGVELRADHVRNDEDIALAAADAIRWNAFVPRDSVQAAVEKGWVTLTGKVDWQYQRDAADAAVRHLIGVKAVINSIEVRPRVQPKPTDVKHRIHDAFRRNAELEARRIGIDVHGGEVKLHGNVHSFAEVEAARRAAWAVPGVFAVNCDLHVVH